MILFTLTAPNVVLVSGLDLSLASPAEWRIGLERMATTLQAAVAVSYRLERTDSGLRFRENTPAWTLWKVLRGYSGNRGVYLRRILGTLERTPLWGITHVRPDGTATITLSEGKLQALNSHAIYYARKKVPGFRIIQLSMGTVNAAGGALRAYEAVQIDHKQRIANERAKTGAGRGITIAPDGRRMTIPAQIARKPITLARTAWAAATATAARLRRL